MQRPHDLPPWPRPVSSRLSPLFLSAAAYFLRVVPFTISPLFLRPRPRRFGSPLFPLQRHLSRRSIGCCARRAAVNPPYAARPPSTSGSRPVTLSLPCFSPPFRPRRWCAICRSLSSYIISPDHTDENHSHEIRFRCSPVKTSFPFRAALAL